MSETTVTSKGQVTIPSDVRRQLGIRQGTVVTFQLVGDYVELRVASRSHADVVSGFGMLRSHLPPAPADLDPATLVDR